MNIIVLSRRLGRAHQVELNRPLPLLIAVLAVTLLLGATFSAGMLLGRGELLAPASEISIWRGTLARQRAEVAETRQLMQERLDALATRVAVMNAHVIRIDALGRRLTEVAGLDKGEFNFDRAPGTGGPEALVENASALAPDLSSVLDYLADQIRDREQQLAVLENLLSTRHLSSQLVPDGRPVKQGWISSYFGHRTDPFSGRRAFHRGLDFAGPAGADVVAVAAGVVTWAKDRSAYGRTVEVTHGNGYVTRYGHNQVLLVKVGERVAKGQTIARMGSTGRSTGPHVHFEVLKNGHAVNPTTFVRGARN